MDLRRWWAADAILGASETNGVQRCPARERLYSDAIIVSVILTLCPGVAVPQDVQPRPLVILSRETEFGLGKIPQQVSTPHQTVLPEDRLVEVVDQVEDQEVAGDSSAPTEEVPTRCPHCSRMIAAESSRRLDGSPPERGGCPQRAGEGTCPLLLRTIRRCCRATPPR